MGRLRASCVGASVDGFAWMGEYVLVVPERDMKILRILRIYKI